MFESKSGSGMERKTVGGLIEDFFAKTVGAIAGDDLWADRSANVPVNIKETPVGYDMQLVAPGLTKEDFKIHLDRNLLIVSFDHLDELQSGEEGRWLRQEFKQRSFRRAFTLNDRIDTSAIAARYADGILHLNLPKKDTVDVPQQIHVG